MAASHDSEVVEMAGTSETSRSPKRMIDPLPNLFSILSSADSIARLRSPIRSSGMTGISFFCSSYLHKVVLKFPSSLNCAADYRSRFCNETKDNTIHAGMEQSFMGETS